MITKKRRPQSREYTVRFVSATPSCQVLTDMRPQVRPAWRRCLAQPLTRAGQLSTCAFMTTPRSPSSWPPKGYPDNYAKGTEIRVLDRARACAVGGDLSMPDGATTANRLLAAGGGACSASRRAADVPADGACSRATMPCSPSIARRGSKSPGHRLAGVAREEGYTMNVSSDLFPACRASYQDWTAVRDLCAPGWAGQPRFCCKRLSAAHAWMGTRLRRAVSPTSR